MKYLHASYITSLLAVSFMGVIFFWKTALISEMYQMDSEGYPMDGMVLLDQASTAVDYTPTVEEEQKVDRDNNPIFEQEVPFVSQAPYGQWSDPMFQNACEEASLVMAAHWISGAPLSKASATREITDLSGFEKKSLGHSIDTSAADTADFFRSFYNIGTASVRYNITAEDIRAVLVDGALVVVPTNGRKLSNPNFKHPGPLTHMLVIIGYDRDKEEFITNDPGTRLGKGYRYKEKVLVDAIRDYPTGEHVLITKERTAMIIIRKKE